MPFAEWLESQIKARGMTQQQLAHVVGVYPSTVSVWLRGKSIPGDQTTETLAEFFNVEKAFLLQLMGKLDGSPQVSSKVAARIHYIEQQIESIEDERERQVISEFVDEEMQSMTAKIETWRELFLKFKGEKRE